MQTCYTFHIILTGHHVTSWLLGSLLNSLLTDLFIDSSTLILPFFISGLTTIPFLRKGLITVSLRSLGRISILRRRISPLYTHDWQ